VQERRSKRDRLQGTDCSAPSERKGRLYYASLSRNVETRAAENL
jgi:hypothetical protein